MIEANVIMQALETLSYVGLFLWLVLYNFLFFAPLPPYEPVLLTLGYVAHMGFFNPLILIIVIITAAVVTDNIFFFFSRKGNASVQKLMKKYSESTFLKYKNKLEEHYFKSSLLISFIPKVRIFGPVISGTLNMKWRKFFLANVVANSAEGTVYVFLGYFFHDAIQGFIKDSSLANHLFFYLLIIVFAISIFFLVKKYVFMKNNNAVKM